jgi:dynein heavy chain
MLSTIVNIQPKDSGSGGGETRETVVYRLADDMLSKLPSDYNPFEVRDRLDKMGALKPLHIFLKQEIDRMQRVITVVRSTLCDLKLAIEGTIIMSENLRDALDNMYDARIPNTWKKISWESATLGFWFTDLLDRNAQFHSWLYEGRPVCYWMTGFFNPQGFLTAMRQEITRMHKGWALDAVILSNEITKNMKEDVTAPPSEGVYVYGLYLDGAGWDRRNAKLIEPQAKVLYTMLPVAYIYAVSINQPEKSKGSPPYECPVYKKPKRTDLNYIFPLALKTSKDPDHWIMRGVALLCDIK